MSSIADLRREYARRALGEDAADPDPIRQFTSWFDEAIKSQILDASAMTLATTNAAGDANARIVLLKGVDDAGFTFFTNYDSAKGSELAARPRASLLFFWAELERQVRITGSVAKVDRSESEKYFHSRPFESQIGAWASAQSSPVANREALETRFAELAAQHAGKVVPLPPFWGGYRVKPERMEFWQGRPSRLHDRLLYTRESSGTWSRSRLAP
jgi:pyridoxamine 5'-phosphate oxidase